MKTFTLNGNQVFQKDITYNMVCDFEECGISLADIQNKSMSFVRAYIASCLGADADTAGAEIQAHIIGGGSFSDLTDAVREALEDSDFFHALGQRTQKNYQSSKKNRKTATAED